MKEEENIGSSRNENEPSALSPDQYLELWKHFASAGGADKTAMVTVASLLLGFSATIIGYIVTQLTKPDSIYPSEPTKVILLSCLGIFISVLAAYVAFLYGAYANWNWANADNIAEKNGWEFLLPTSNVGRDIFAACLARPKDTKDGFAPVFWVFVGLAGASIAAHLYFLICSATAI